MKTDLFQSCGHCWVFQICWHIECSTLIASSFRIWNSSTGIPSPPLALFIVMLSKAHLKTCWWKKKKKNLLMKVKEEVEKVGLKLNIPKTPRQYSCLEKPMGSGAWQATVHGIAKTYCCEWDKRPQCREREPRQSRVGFLSWGRAFLIIKLSTDKCTHACVCMIRG